MAGLFRGLGTSSPFSLSSVRRDDPPERFGEAITGGRCACLCSGGHHPLRVRFCEARLKPDIRYSHPPTCGSANDPPTADP